MFDDSGKQFETMFGCLVYLGVSWEWRWWGNLGWSLTGFLKLKDGGCWRVDRALLGPERLTYRQHINCYVRTVSSENLPKQDGLLSTSVTGAMHSLHHVWSINPRNPSPWLNIHHLDLTIMKSFIANGGTWGTSRWFIVENPIYKWMIWGYLYDSGNHHLTFQHDIVYINHTIK